MKTNLNPLEELNDAFTSIGHPIYSDEFLARVLAWACLSGFPEALVLNKALYSVTMIAAKRFKIQGGQVPDVQAIMKYWKPALEELREFGAKTPWLPKLMDRYKVVGWKEINYAEWAPEFQRILNNAAHRKGTARRR